MRLRCNVKQNKYVEWLDELQVFVFCYQEFLGQEEQVWPVLLTSGFVWESSEERLQIHRVEGDKYNKGEVTNTQTGG